MEKEYSSINYDVYKVSVPFLAITSIYFYIVYVLFKTVLTQQECSILLGIFFLSVILFMKKLRIFATRRILLHFSDEGINITEYHLTKDIELSEYLLKWDQIRYYSYYHTKDNVNHIVLAWDDGKKKDFGIQDNKNLDETLKEDGILGIFHSFIKSYNLKSGDHQITLSKGFLNTNTGKYVVNFVGVLVIIGIIIHVSINPKTSFISIMAGMMYYFIVLVSKKKNEIMYKKISELD